MRKAMVTTVARYMPDAAPDPADQMRGGYIGRPLNRVDGPLKVTGAARSPPSTRRRPRPCRARLQHHRQRPDRSASIRPLAEAAPGRHRRHHVPATRPRMKAPTLFDVTGERQGCAAERSPDHAGRQRPLERPAGRRGRRRHAGAGGVRGVARRASTTRRSRRASPSTTLKADASVPADVIGEPPEVRGWRRRMRRSPQRRVSGRCRLPHALVQPQRHRATRHRALWTATITSASSMSTQAVGGFAATIGEVFGLKADDVRRDRAVRRRRLRRQGWPVVAHGALRRGRQSD